MGAKLEQIVSEVMDATGASWGPGSATPPPSSRYKKRYCALVVTQDSDYADEINEYLVKTAKNNGYTINNIQRFGATKLD